MRFVLALLSITAQAGVIRGVVTEHLSGRPLARTIVRLQPIPQAGVENKPMQTRATVSGTFVFDHIPDGLYFLFAQREPYYPAYYGQRRPEGFGSPVTVTRESDLFAELSMYRKGAITGRVLDENGIGMQDVPVVAYRARLPLRAAGRGVSDDRGVYRIFGLAPGKYWVRSVEHTLDDGEGRLPTFGRLGRQISESVVHQVRLDEDALDADVQPFPGRLFRLRGRLLCLASPVPIIVVLSSETGRKQTQGGCMQTYTFEGVGPGSYEVFAQKQEENGDAGFVELQLDHDSDGGDVMISPLPRIDFIVSGAKAASIRIFGHRQDLAESDADKEIPRRAFLAPGHWEFTAVVPGDAYVQSLTNAATARRAREQGVVHPPDWFDVFIEPRGFPQIAVAVSDQATKLEGTVTRDGKPVAGAPVYLWPMAESARRSLHGYRTVLADVGGKFMFDGLPPGDYRMVATFDVTEIDEEKLDEARAVTVRADLGSRNSADLILWIAP